MLEVLAVLQDIAAAQNTALCTKTASSPAMSRQFNSKGEFSALVQRVQHEEATVVLRKLFLYSKKNPDAKADPLKSYAVIHVHHHKQQGMAEV